MSACVEDGSDQQDENPEHRRDHHDRAAFQDVALEGHHRAEDDAYDRKKDSGYRRTPAPRLSVRLRSPTSPFRL